MPGTLNLTTPRIQDNDPRIIIKRISFLIVTLSYISILKTMSFNFRKEWYKLIIYLFGKMTPSIIKD